MDEDFFGALMHSASKRPMQDGKN